MWACGGAHTAAFVAATLGLSFSVMHDKKRKKRKYAAKPWNAYSSLKADGEG